MSWKVRHEGSPKTVEVPSAQAALQGLVDGDWEPTDEVRGPNDSDWVAFEEHPQFAEVASEIEPPPPRIYDDETHLDFNALIDVCLVLLIFFILTTTYVQLQKIIDTPAVTSDKIDAGKIVAARDVKESMIHITADQKGDQTEIKVEGEVVPLENLNAKLQSLQGAAEKLSLLLQHSDQVPFGTLVAIQDFAKSNKIEEVLLAPLSPER